MVDALPHPVSDGMYPVGQRPPLGSYLAEAWRRRSFAFTLARFRLVGGLLKNRLGVLWIVLKPTMLALLYGVIFHFVLSGSARPHDFVQFLIVGVFVFEFFTGSFSNGSKAITGNAKLVQSLGFPRVLLPVAAVVEQALRTIPVIVLLCVLLLILGETPTWSWLMIIPIIAVMAVFNLGIALIMARLSVHARDVQQLIPIITRVLFYASGIFFNVDGALAPYPTILAVAHLVPTYEFIALSRDALLQAHTAPLAAWVGAPIWALVVIIAGVVFFWRAEARYGLSD